ncbi:hypothetical protein [Govanella unica]|uniref:Uncharacterized protein n=1 Tax=Govanella unica TaxID=2975056 RepID=A0A9X3TXF0_9PROT|nr:hypothetical protein [Govania unica]MDA5193526.1 hypothetical protein [Govania unica]
MNERAEETLKIALEDVLGKHFATRPYGRLALREAGRDDDPRGRVTVHHHQARDDIVEFRAELHIAAPLDQERRLMDRMLESIDILHEADIPSAVENDSAFDDPIILSICLETAKFERIPSTEEATARLIFLVRTTTDS